MEHKHFAKAHEVHAKLDGVQPALDADAKDAQFKRALADEFPELSESDVASLAAKQFSWTASFVTTEAASDPAPLPPPDPNQSVGGFLG